MSPRHPEIRVLLSELGTDRTHVARDRVTTALTNQVSVAAAREFASVSAVVTSRSELLELCGHWVTVL